MITTEAIVDYFADLAQRAYPESLTRDKSARDLRTQYAALKVKSISRTLDDSERAIYGVTRLSGTLTAMNDVLAEFTKRGLKAPRSILDCGSGPGTALFASFLQFGTSAHYVGLEKDPGFIAMAKRALVDILPQASPHASFIEGIIPHIKIDKRFDLTIFSYMLSETPPEKLEATIRFALQRTAQYLVIVDAGTPHVYRQLMTARQSIIAEGWSIVAPCTHQLACPMAAPDFCHFPARFIRHEEARRLKGARAQAEDEKYCYLIAEAPDAQEKRTMHDRIVKRPLKRSGHIILDACGPDGRLKRHIVSKKQKHVYVEGKRALWGDIIDFSPDS